MNRQALQKHSRATVIVRALVALACAAAPLVPLYPTVAYADGNADEADLHFQIAAEAYSKGDFRTALEHFLLSNRLVPNRNVVFNIARTYEQLRRFADAHRYYVDALDGETNAATVSTIQDAVKRIAPNVAVLRVESDPPGATIYIDRKDLGSRGRAPKPLAIAEGKYKVIVELDGYEPATIDGIEAKIGGEAKVPFKLKRIVGTVAVTIDGAPDAAVHLDDENATPICTAPCTFEAAPGTHLVYFSRDGFQAPPRQINIVAKETTKTAAVMTPLTGSMVVQADERDAIVEIDGKPAGFTPAVIQNISVGSRKVRVTLRGYAPVERDIAIKANQQTQLLDLKLVPLRQVAAASRLTENIEDAPSSVTIIDGQELRAFGYPTIAEALRGVRGVALHNDHVYAGTNVRGLGQPNDYGNRLLVLNDGAVMNDSIGSQGFIGNEARTDLEDVDRIEIVRGPGSLLYGTGAMSGVVNLVPRAKEEPSSVNVRFGTYDNSVVKAAARAGYARGDKAGFWVSGGASRSDGLDYVLVPRDTTLAPVTVNQVDFFRAASAAARAWVGDFTAQFVYTQRQQSTPIGIFGERLNDANNYYLDQRMMGEIRYEPKVNKYFQIFSRAYVNHYHFNGQYVYDAPPAPVSTENYYGTWFGAEARAVITPVETLRLSLGVQGEFHVLANMNGDYGGEKYLDQSSPFNLVAPYGVLDWQIGKNVRISAGARGDFYSGKDADPFPSIRGAFIAKPWTGGVLKLMGGSAFRAPSFYEQYYTDGGVAQLPASGVNPATGVEIKNPLTKSEKILTGEVEFSQRFAEDWVALASGWVSKVDDVIRTVEVDSEGNPSPGSGVVQYQNSPTPQLNAGFDIEVRREWRQGWMVSVGYGYQKATFVQLTAGDPLTTNPRVTNAPEHLASARGVVPIVPDLASLGMRITLEAPRRGRHRQRRDPPAAPSSSATSRSRATSSASAWATSSASTTSPTRSIRSPRRRLTSTSSRPRMAAPSWPI